MVQAVSLRPLRMKNFFHLRLFYVTFQADKLAATKVDLRVLRGSFASIIPPVPSKYLHLYKALSRTYGQSQ